LVIHSVGGIQIQNRMLRKVFGPTRDEVTGEWRSLPNPEFYDSTPNIRVIKSRRIRWAGNVARMGDRTVFWCGDLRERPRGRTRCRWIILKRIFKTLDGESWSGLICLWIGISGGRFECSIGPLGSTKCGKYLEYLRTF